MGTFSLESATRFDVWSIEWLQEFTRTHRIRIPLLSFYPYQKFLFRCSECAFRSTEWPFRTCECTFRSTERRFLMGECTISNIHHQQIVPNYFFFLLRPQWPFALQAAFLRANLKKFGKKTWAFQKIIVFLHRQNPPRFP